ncbi:MAG TPA: type II secretion system minor pseudopilin GspI [Steroidobacteraceae bacterium]|jgi:general secretion pathway protein I|nr:type II secretion system minor pseudopilin GspI [Steroidobacteraceae bacterium]
MRVGKGGFTLIEVMVALIVVALGMLGAITAVSQAASNGGYLRERSMAHWVAMNRLTEARLQKNAPPISKTSDEVEMGGRKWKWTMNVTQTQVETMRRIDVSVRPVEAPETSSLASITGFYGTAVAPPGSAMIAWQGATDSGPQRPGDKGKEDEQQGQPNPPGDDEDPGPLPEPDDPQDGIDPSDPTQPH